MGGLPDDLFQFNLWLIQCGRPIRTRRLYLSSAAGLLRSAGVGTLTELDQRSVQERLITTPGSRANLTAVMRFARERLGHALELPAPTRRVTKQPKPVTRLRALLRRIEASGESAAMEDLERAVAIALKIPHRAIRAGKWWPERRARSWRVVSCDEVVLCPRELLEVVSRWYVMQVAT